MQIIGLPCGLLKMKFWENYFELTGNMFQKITSRDNQKLKYARSVRGGKVADAVYIEGVRHGEEVLRSSSAVRECFFVEDLTEDMRGRELINAVSETGANVSVVANSIFQTIADAKTSQGIILIVEKPRTLKDNFESKFKDFLNDFPVVLLLSEINNPSNLGAILRTIEAVGAAHVIISENSADAFSPKAGRAAMGANLRLNIWENAALPEVLAWANEKNLVTTAADIGAKNSYTQIDWKSPRLLIFGSEAHGLSADVLNFIEQKIYIPMENDVESLNLAVSCGIILFEAKRQIG